MGEQRREKGTGSIRPDTSRRGEWKGTGKNRTWTGSWIGAITVDGRRFSSRGRSKTDVAAKLSTIKAEALTGAGRGRDDRKTTVADVIDRFLERDLPDRTSNARPLAPGTVRNYRIYLGAVRDEIGKVKVSNLTVDRVEKMLDRLAAQGYTHVSLTNLRSMFATVIDSAVRRELVQRNVVRLATIPPTAKRSERRHALSPDDARKLLAQLRTERNGAMYGLGLYLGLRPGEAAALFWSDLDLDAGTVNITRGVQRDGGKVQVVDDLKTEQSKRTIEMPDDLTAWLREHRQAQREERMAAKSWIDERLVFTTPTGNVTDPKHNRNDLTAICERAGVPRTLPVELRHSCASLLADEGVMYEAIADLLGHTTTRMVDRTYKHRLRPVVDVAARASWASESS